MALQDATKALNTPGADSVVEETFASLSWATDEGKFSFMDMTASINPDVLFAMAEEIIK